MSVDVKAAKTVTDEWFWYFPDTKLSGVLFRQILLFHRLTVPSVLKVDSSLKMKCDSFLERDSWNTLMDTQRKSIRSLTNFGQELCGMDANEGFVGKFSAPLSETGLVQKHNLW